LFAVLKLPFSIFRLSPKIVRRTENLTLGMAFLSLHEYM